MFPASAIVGTQGPARGSSPLQHTPTGNSVPSSHEPSLPSAHPLPPSYATKILWVHTDFYSKRDFLIDPAFFPNVQPNDLFEIYDPALPKELSKKLIIQWTGVDKDTHLKAPVQVSLASNIAKAFGLSPRQDVIVQRADPSQYAAKYVELTFRDQYVGRSDMWRLRTSLLGTCVYEAKKIVYLGCIRVQVKEIYIGNQSVPSGYITSETRIIFRSESAKYFIFIQMSREMWEFDEDGEIFFEQVIFGFLPNLFARWRGRRDGKQELESPTNHVVSIVLFSRIFYQEEEEARFRVDGYPGGQTGLQRDDEGRYYQDFYKVVIDWETRTDWTTAIIPLKEEIMRYQRDIMLQPSGEYQILAGENSYAFEGNVLEAINLALNSLDKHYVDRDLQRTGLSIVMVTPGSGMFDVDKRLLRLTTERMISGGIGLDMVCLSKIPAHIVPLFRWKGPVADSNGLSLMGHGTGHSPSNISGNGNNLAVRSTNAYSRPNSRPASIKESADMRPSTPFSRNYKSTASNPSPDVMFDMSDPLYYDAPPTFPSSMTKTYFVMPHWVDCMFYVGSRKPNPQKFYTRCKMYELQMMGIMEHEISSISIPYLNESYNTTPFGKRLSSTDALTPRTHFAKTIDFDKHDEDLFHDSNSPLAAEIKQLNMSSNQGSRGIARDAISLDNLEASSTRLSTGRRYDGYLGGPAHQSVSNHKPSTELSRSLPRGWNASMAMSNAIPENQVVKDTSTGPGRVSFSLKSANGFLEDSRASKQADKTTGNDYDAQNELNSHDMHDDLNADQTSYGRTSHYQSDARPRSSHARTSTDDDVGFLSSSTVKPIYITRNYRAFQDDGAPSETSAADSCNTGSLSSDKGHRTFIANPAGTGGRFVQTRQKSKYTSINPCNPPKTIIRMTSNLRRWQHAFPRVKARCASPNLIRSEVYTDGLSNTEAWRGLISPASLPLTTDFFPSKEELQELYSQYINTISPSEDVGSFGQDNKGLYAKEKALIKELIYHRLGQGFQLIVSTAFQSSKATRMDALSASAEKGGSSGTTGAMANQGGNADNQADPAGMDFPSKDAEAANGVKPGKASKDKAYYLSMGQQVHRLTIDSAHGNVEVKRYERRLGYKPENIKYHCVIWAKHLPGYMPRELSFTYPLLSHYQWNYLDHLVSGYQDEFTEDLLYWRTRFILIPLEHVPSNNLTNVAGEQLDDEEMRLAGFQRFLDLFQRARYVENQNDRASLRKQDSSIKVQLNTCSLAAWAFTQLSKKDCDTGPSSASYVPVLAESEKLTRNSKIQTIAAAIQNPLTGVKLQDRRWHLFVYDSAFLGNEVVDWLIQNFADIENREEATDFGKKLFDKGMFVHYQGKHSFMDGHYFYRFSDEFALPSTKQSKRWFRNPTTSLTKRDVDVDKIQSKEKDSEVSEKTRPSNKLTSMSTSGSTVTLGSVAPASTNIIPVSDNTAQSPNSGVSSLKEKMETLQKALPRKVDMSRAVTIDVDPNKRSDRRETAMLHYDLAHNIKHCYHFQLHWLGCTARLIEDMLQTWGRTAERCGLRIVEVPMEQDIQGGAFNPFESPIPIKLALRPPLTKGLFKPSSSLDTHMEPVQVPKLHFYTELVKSHGFILDMESDELYPPAAQLNYTYKRAPYKHIQYVHRSGVAFIQISYSGSYEFYWVNNRLLTSHSVLIPERERSDWDRSKTSGGTGGGNGQDTNNSVGGPATSKSSSSQVPNPDVLRRKFEATCADKEELARIWGEVSSHLETMSGIQDILEDGPDDKVEREGLAWAMPPATATPRRKSETQAGTQQSDPSSSKKEAEGGVDEGVSGDGPNVTNVPIIRIDVDS
ncbi:hypothetical protein B0O80DRAFT_451156 [Mortierella sp. GBAus27b]|nr:vacuolar membrane-associated protein iml1 [Mortierella sp. GBA43]KAI8354480.1 hypothetical protein B0O80DRAFT_451156 [Mortierella sp. GBAus27b]